MAQIAEMKVIILWEHEVIAAAIALQAAVDASKDKANSDDVCDKLWSTAMRACHAALYNPEITEGGQIVILPAKMPKEKGPVSV